MYNVVHSFFPLYGDLVVADNGYPGYSAVSKRLPNLHGAEWVSLHTIKGRIVKPGLIKLGSSARLGFRLPIEKISEVLALSGTILEIGGHEVQCGVPRIHRLQPSPDLWSRLVIIKQAHNKTNPWCAESFLESIYKQLAHYGVSATPRLEMIVDGSGRPVYARRILKIKNVLVAGYGVYLQDLTDDDSITIQSCGLGGRHRMGAGIFIPVTKGGRL